MKPLTVDEINIIIADMEVVIDNGIPWVADDLKRLEGIIKKLEFMAIMSEEPHLQSGKLAYEIGVPLEFGHWCLADFTIDAEPQDLPKLTATYSYYKKELDVATKAWKKEIK